jgi:glutamyl-tRNA(Gln) amidotransferase subunit E
MDELFEYPKANGSSVAMEKSGHYKSEFEKLEKMLECERGDIIVVVHGGEARKAVSALEERVRGLCIGVPEETRKPNPDGTTSFARPLPGSERMYPETDCLPVKITKRMIEKIENSLPKTLNEKKEELEKSLPKEIASQLIRSQYLGIYESMAKKIKSKENLLAVATTFTSTLKDMSRSGIQTDKIPEACFELIFNTLDRGKITAKAIPEILERIANGDNAEAALSSFETLDKDDIEKIISEALRENPDLQISALMGIVMAKLKGKADGKTVMEILKKMVK